MPNNNYPWRNYRPGLPEEILATLPSVEIGEDEVPSLRQRVQYIVARLAMRKAVEHQKRTQTGHNYHISFGIRQYQDKMLFEDWHPFISHLT